MAPDNVENIETNYSHNGRNVSFEDRALIGIQRLADKKPEVYKISRYASAFGEHSLGWLLLSFLGALLSKRKRADWISVGFSAILAHLASVLIKRQVKRPRPSNPCIKVGVKTPSNYSFPSSHASSTAASATALAYLFGLPRKLLTLPLLVPMALSRMILGVHYPSDVLTGGILGIWVAKLLKLSGLVRLFSFVGRILR